MGTAPRFAITLLTTFCIVAGPFGLTWAAGRSGQLDPSFNYRGRIILTDVGEGTFEAVHAMAVQPDGKIVAVGFSTPAVGPSSDFALVRYESTGRVDRWFGDNGRVLTDFSGTGSTDEAFAVAIDSIGRIVVAGYSSSNVGVDFAVARYQPDGTPDSAFNSTGKVLTNFGGSSFDTATAVAIDWNDKIVVAGSSNAGGTYDFAVVRYNVDGTLDTTFNSTGRVLTDFSVGSGDFATAAVIQSDGKIVVGGLSDASGIPYDFSLLRYNPNGTLDPTFNATGKVLTDFSGSGSYDTIQALAIQSDGRIVAAGYSLASGRSHFALARYTTNGILDGTFNSTGKVLTAFPSGSARADDVAIQSDGRIVVAGSFDDGNREGPDFALARYNTDGTPDSTFNSTGRVVTDIGGFDVAYGVGIQSDGKIVAAGFSDVNGTSDFALARYIP
jgi:uncharacterized delta-60 repeat protein